MLTTGFSGHGDKYHGVAVAVAAMGMAVKNCVEWRYTVFIQRALS
jgi:hypothetical protein